MIVVTSKFSIANRLAKSVVDGWELAPLVHILSGAPFTVTSGVDNSLTDVGNDRPSLIAGVSPYLNGPIRSASGAENRNFLNPAAFCSAACIAPGTYGTLGRNAFRGRTSYEFDAQLSRIFPIHESLNATLRIEAFNVLNHPNSSTPTASTASSTFGQVSAASAARIFQGSVKFNF